MNSMSGNDTQLFPSHTQSGDRQLVTGNIISIMDSVISCDLVPATALLGIIANCINIIVLYHHRLSDSTNILLMAMSVADLLFLITIVPRRLACLVARFDKRQSAIMDAVMVTYIRVPNRYFGLVSSALVTLVSAERFTAVRFPLHVSQIFSPRRTMGMVVILGCCWLAVSVPFFPVYTTRWVFDQRFNSTVLRAFLTSYYLTNQSVIGSLNMCLAMFRGPLSILVILISSLVICKRLYQASRQRAKLTFSKVTYDVKVVKMLLVVSLTYAAIGLPLFVPYILHFAVPTIAYNKDKTVSNIVTLMEIINDFLYVVNASINFIIYVTMSSKFYKTYSRLFTRHKTLNSHVLTSLKGTDN